MVLCDNGVNCEKHKCAGRHSRMSSVSKMDCDAQSIFDTEDMVEILNLHVFHRIYTV